MFSTCKVPRIGVIGSKRFQKINDIISGFWPSEDGSMPLDEPLCGFRGQKCSYLLEISIGSLMLLLIVISIAFYILFKYWYATFEHYF